VLAEVHTLELHPGVTVRVDPRAQRVAHGAARRRAGGRARGGDGDRRERAQRDRDQRGDARGVSR